MDYLLFFNLLNKNHFISLIWKDVLKLIKDDIKGDVDQYLAVFTILFSLVDDGNIAMSIDKNKLLEKWNHKINSTQILMMELDDYQEEDFNVIREYSKSIIDNYLSRLNGDDLINLVGDNKIFQIDNDFIYIKKYNDARRSIMNSINFLFENSSKYNEDFNYKECGYKYNLSDGQESAVKKGINKNLIITGGPGTGKTTSILFLLLGLLTRNPHYDVKLAAPSGKASSRMKESIVSGLENISEDYKNKHQEICDKINNLEESTIHSLLGIDYDTHAFRYNSRRQFNVETIFIIDEASMIDICLFASLLEAIPQGARIFIMGDKNQLPSVEAGSVFSELLKNEKLKENIITLDESIRFKKGTKIYSLADSINNGYSLPISPDDWRDYKDFEVNPLDKTHCPIYYYQDSPDTKKNKEIIESIILKWGMNFYRDLQGNASNLAENDASRFNDLYYQSERAKILSAQNEGKIGVKSINQFVKNIFIDQKQLTASSNNYAGQTMMINKNNKFLDLYNGDSGITVMFKDDNQLYFMIKKTPKIPVFEGKRNDEIFKIGEYVFYPMRVIAKDDIDLAYAITIHKSQGSDYEQILVILPNKKGHPLLNRQIVYTAITRTKGNTYIISNIDRLNEAKDTVLTRDTNIN